MRTALGKLRPIPDSSSGTRDDFQRWQYLIRVESELELVRQRKLGPEGAGESGSPGKVLSNTEKNLKRRQGRW